MSNPSVFDKSNLTRVVIAAAAVAVPLATLAFLRSRGKKPVRVPVVDQMPSSPAQWTTAHVNSWLRTLQVSPDALKAFEEGEVDGSVLLMLQETHLRDMGVRRVGDVIKITSALQALRGESSGPATRETAPDSARNAEPQDDDAKAARLAEECRERLKGVHTFLGSEKLAQAPPRAQIAALNQVEVELHQVLRAISALPPSNSRQELLKNAFETEQLAVRLRETISTQESGAAPQGAPSTASTGAPATAAGSPDWERVIKAVTDSLQNLHGIIMSEEAATAPLSQRKEVFAVVSSQLDKIRQVVAQLPNEVRESVSKACDSVQRQATVRLMREEAQPAAASREAHPQPAQTQTGMLTSDGLIGELRKIFVDLQSADLISEPSETKQATTLASLLHRIDEVKTVAASQLRGEERVLVLEMCAKIQEAVQQTGATCAKKNEIVRNQGHGHSHEHHSHDHSHGEHSHHHHSTQPDDKKVSFVEVMQGLNDITTALKSEAFSKLSPEVRRATLEKMWNRLIALEPAIHALPDSDRSDVAPIFSKLKQYFSFALSGESASTSNPRAAPTPASTAASTATQASDDSQTSLELRRAQAEKVQSILGLLQAMYSLFNSKEFLQAPPQQQQNFLTSAAAQLRQLEGAVQSLGQDDKTAIMPLFTGISDYVVALKNAIEADLASPTNAPPQATVSPSKSASAGTNTQQHQGAAATKGKSPGILSPRVENAASAEEVQQTILNVMEEVTGSLNDMLLLIRSEDAKTASREQREGLVRAVYDQVIRIASFADKLPEEERATLKSLCAQVLEESQGLLSIKTKRGQAAQADGEEPVGKSPSPAREGTSPAQRRRQQEEKEVAEAESAVLQTLQSISNLLASEDFRRQTPETRVKISMSLAKRLEAMDPVIRSLPEADRQVLAHQVHLIRSVLAAVNGDATAEVDQEEEERAEAEAQAEADEAEENEEDAEGEEEEGEEEGDEEQEAGQRSAPTEQDRATQMAAASIASRLQQLYAVVSSKQFEDAAPPEQLQLLTAVERQLGPLERDISTLKDSPHRNSLSEVLGNLRQILTVYRRPLRGTQSTDVFRRAAEATALMESGEVKTLGKIKEMMELLEEIDQVPTKTELQLKIRKAFQQALSRTIDSVSANVSEGNVDEEDEEGEEGEEEGDEGAEEDDGDEVVHLPSPGSYNAPSAQTATRNARATEERDEKADLDESDFGDLDQGTRAFVRAVLGIRSMLRGPEVVSTADASKTAGALQAVLQNAKTKNIAWQQNSAVVELVRSVLEDLEAARENATDEAAQGTVQMLNEAAAQLRQSEPGLKSVTDLAPWLSLLDTVNEMQSELGVEELQALQGFQQEILRASRNIRERMDLQPSARNPTVSPRKNQNQETSPARSPRPPQ